MHRGLVGLKDPHHRGRLSVDGPDPRDPGNLGVHVEEPGDPARRRGVHHHRVEDRSTFALAPDRLGGLAGEQHVAHPGCDRGREVDRPEPLERRAGPAQVVEHLQVLQQRRLGVDGEGQDLSTLRRPGHPALLVGQRGGVEQLGDPLAALHLHQQDPATAGGQRQRERGSDRRLPGPALAGHEVQPDPREQSRRARAGHAVTLTIGLLARRAGHGTSDGPRGARQRARSP